MTTPVAPFNGQAIGLAHYASRAALERVLARSGTTFEQSVALRAASGDGGTVERALVVGRLTAGLKIDESAARRTVGELTARGLLEEPTPERVSLTDAGRELFSSIRAAGDEIASRVYAGIPAEDLAVVARVLALVTERADAELAGE
ncbi:MarR family winged helix-turn-helix transcriptional regulator [Streptomyces triticiradicis]|uniref:MarR family transcriptional regulator n=1 Tax=Streptomyces triticiradicis TaxID=2651189 RepID=A0A7J5DNQ3_9ACTN|nr:MarR family transcriptional regulator [Streptomyces triticiradicis]KAB1990417.1 MarR family transcriptional regulator [Streptomyces triticiradicis]